MKTNYEILKQIQEEIKEFNYMMSDIETTMSVEEYDIVDMFEKEPDLLKLAFETVVKIKNLLDRLTSGMMSLLEEFDIEFDSFVWSVGKVLHSEIEIINYLETFEVFVNNLEFVIVNRLSEYETLNELTNVTSDAK